MKNSVFMEPEISSPFSQNYVITFCTELAQFSPHLYSSVRSIMLSFTPTNLLLISSLKFSHQTSVCVSHFGQLLLFHLKWAI